MNRYCTCLDSTLLARSRLLHQSLLQHAGKFELVILALDEAAGDAVSAEAWVHTSILRVTDLLGRHPRLAAAQGDRTAGEFAATCKPWLLMELLPRIPPGERLTLVDASLYFFHSPAMLFERLGPASIALAPRRPTPGCRGHFHASWVTLRHDDVGLAAATAWAGQCATWCFGQPAAGRYLEEKYLDDWPRRFPGTVVFSDPGAVVAPCDVADRPVTAGPEIGGNTLICFHFGDLVHLTRQLYDAGLQTAGGGPTPGLREFVYRPYLQRLAGILRPPPDDVPDILPPADPNDPRVPEVLNYLLGQTRAAALARLDAEAALARIRAEWLGMIAEDRARAQAAEHYTRCVEKDRDQQRQAFFATRTKLEQANQDLIRNIAYLKKLEAEAAAQRQASLDRETYITDLKRQLARRNGGGTASDPVAMHLALRPHARDLRRLLVANYHPALMPAVMCLAAQGVNIEVLGSPPELQGQTPGSVHFLGGNLWDWLGGLASYLDEHAYREANPDVASAITAGQVQSGWDHYHRFGQHEGRPTGNPAFRSGFADFDALAFDSADAPSIVPCLIGRLEPHHRLFISSSFNPPTVWLPDDTARTVIIGDLLGCTRPPPAWIGPPRPSALAVPHRTRPGPADVFPDKPAQQAVWPKISLVIYLCNQAKHAEAVLRSALDQNYPDLELLVVDGGSTDTTSEVVRRFSDRIAWWTVAPGAGAAAGVNVGAAKSTGSVMAWLEGPDQLAPGSLYTVAQMFLLHDADVVAGRSLCRHGDGSRQIRRSVLALGQIQPLPAAALLDFEKGWLQDWFPLQPASFVARRAWDRAGGRLREELTVAFNYDFWCRLARAGATILPIPEILAMAETEPRPCRDEYRAVNRQYATQADRETTP